MKLAHFESGALVLFDSKWTAVSLREQWSWILLTPFRHYNWTSVTFIEANLDLEWFTGNFALSLGFMGLCTEIRFALSTKHSREGLASFSPTKDSI